MLWLAIHLPLLPLESLAPQEEGRPLAITERQGARQRIILGNRMATAAGIAAGMSPGAARALAGDLCLLARDGERELSALRGVAAWAGRFTSQVALDPPWGVLLELAGSVRLFGDMAALLRALQVGLEALDYSARICLAPTPAAAMLLARGGHQEMVTDRAMLHRAVAPLSLHRLPLDGEKLEALQGMGLESLGDLLRLPAAGLRRRLGPELMDYLERLLGRSPDPRPLFRPPERFYRMLELPGEVRGSAALLFAARRLILELAGFLAARQAGTQCLEWLLAHGDGRETRFRLGLLDPAPEPGRLQMLLQERLARVELPAPVRAIGLLVERMQPLAGRALSLFGERPGAAGVDRQLLERLRTRLGDGAISGIRPVPDHRPERAWRRCAPRGEGQGAGQMEVYRPVPGVRRPLWLLPEPLPLEVIDGWPRHGGGRLDLEPERERIESGWWDGGEVARDYFLARAPAGERLWVYRELTGGRRWFLHGFF